MADAGWDPRTRIRTRILWWRRDIRAIVNSMFEGFGGLGRWPRLWGNRRLHAQHSTLCAERNPSSSISKRIRSLRGCIYMGWVWSAKSFWTVMGTPRKVGNSPAPTSTRKTTFIRLKRLRQLSLRPPKWFASKSMMYVQGLEEKEMLYTQYVRIWGSQRGARVEQKSLPNGGRVNNKGKVDM